MTGWFHAWVVERETCEVISLRGRFFLQPTSVVGRTQEQCGLGVEEKIRRVATRESGWLLTCSSSDFNKVLFYPFIFECELGRHPLTID
jgi:hypothetical protein